MTLSLAHFIFGIRFLKCEPKAHLNRMVGPGRDLMPEKGLQKRFVRVQPQVSESRSESADLQVQLCSHHLISWMLNDGLLSSVKPPNANARSSGHCAVEGRLLNKLLIWNGHDLRMMNDKLASYFRIWVASL